MTLNLLASQWIHSTTNFDCVACVPSPFFASKAVPFVFHWEVFALRFSSRSFFPRPTPQISKKEPPMLTYMYSLCNAAVQTC